MLSKPLLISISALCLVIAVLTGLWQGSMRRVDALTAERDTLKFNLKSVEQGRIVAEAHYKRVARELARYETAIDRLEDAPDEALDPVVLVALCSLYPTDPACV